MSYNLAGSEIYVYALLNTLDCSMVTAIFNCFEHFLEKERCIEKYPNFKGKIYGLTIAESCLKN